MQQPNRPIINNRRSSQNGSANRPGVRFAANAASTNRINGSVGGSVRPGFHPGSSRSRSSLAQGGYSSSRYNDMRHRRVSGRRESIQIRAELRERIRCPARKLARRIMTNDYVKIVIFILVVINAITMGCATIWQYGRTGYILETIDFVFLLIFTVEISLEWLYRGFTLWKDRWLAFDFVIITLSWIAESLRIFRAMRIIRAFRVIGQLGPLRQLVLAIGTTIPRLQSIAFLMILNTYVFAVLFKDLFGHVEVTEDWFGTLWKSAFTCLEMMTMEDWSEAARPLLEEEGMFWSKYLILIYISSMGFIVFNLIVAVVCDAVYMISHKNTRWIEGEVGEDEEEEASEIFEEELPERMNELVNEFRAMVDFQMHLQRLVEELKNEMKEMDLLDENFTMDNFRHELASANKRGPSVFSQKVWEPSYLAEIELLFQDTSHNGDDDSDSTSQDFSFSNY